MKHSFYHFIGSLCLCGIITACAPSADNISIYPAPAQEPLNETYHLRVQGKEVPVYNAKIGMEYKANRERAMDDQPNSHLFYDTAGFASFDLKYGSAEVEIKVDSPIKTVRILPENAAITAAIHNNVVSFTVDRPQQLTVEINNEHIRSLHLFVNPEEKDIPEKNNPNVIYFAPGIHEVDESIEVADNQTVYVAGGAIVRCKDVENVNSNDAEAVRKARRPSFILNGNNISFRGRGIIDQELVNRMKSRRMMSVTGDSIRIEGIILRNSSVWTVSLQDTNHVFIDNIKLLGHRANSDGIDICDSWDVTVRNCFIRTLDDLVVVKTYNRPNGSGNILVEKCVLWNEVAHALGIGAEIRQLVDGVVFRDCDIIGDHCREWSLRVYQCDKGVVKNITFENIRIEEAVKFASLWINEAQWSTDKERGYIENVTFKDITLKKKPTTKGVEFLGFDQAHAVNNVTIDNVVVAGHKLTREDVSVNPYVYNLTVK
ncbi:MAG: glycoside hydrolase family 28 protein [Bacteroides sp.]|nr:glycoside hydrolase family 28 protein [Bacteroides sp.]